MDDQILFGAVAKEVEARFAGESSGHDWWHIYRVWKMAERIGQVEKADMLVVNLGALLHDIADWKFNDGDDTAGPRVAREILEKLSAPARVIDHVCQIISETSFKGANVATTVSTLEAKVVQDADRLDAIGAIGVARTFAYGGRKGRPMYDPNIKPVLHETAEEYKKNVSPTINHFYEKLLLLKDLMNTKTGKEIAEGRHKYMENYLERFFKEWEGQI